MYAPSGTVTRSGMLQVQGFSHCFPVVLSENMIVSVMETGCVELNSSVHGSSTLSPLSTLEPPGKHTEKHTPSLIAGTAMSSSTGLYIWGNRDNTVYLEEYLV